jgi:hypothetical protein
MQQKRVLKSRRDLSCSKVGTTPKGHSPRVEPLDPGLKSWIDNVIVPMLVSEYLAREKESRGSSKFGTPVVACSDVGSSPEEATDTAPVSGNLRSRF